MLSFRFSLFRKLQDAEYLVNIKAYSVSEHFLTIVMQIMEGGSLYDIIHEGKNVPWSMLQKVSLDSLVFPFAFLVSFVFYSCLFSSFFLSSSIFVALLCFFF
jgi:hypothetical protein